MKPKTTQSRRIIRISFALGVAAWVFVARQEGLSARGRRAGPGTELPAAGVGAKGDVSSGDREPTSGKGPCRNGLRVRQRSFSDAMTLMGRVVLWPLRAMAWVVTRSTLGLVGWAEQSGAAHVVALLLDGPQGRLVPYFRWDGSWAAGARLWVRSRGCPTCGLDLLAAGGAGGRFFVDLWLLQGLGRGFGWSVTGDIERLGQASGEDLGLEEPAGAGSFGWSHWGGYLGGRWQGHGVAIHLRVGLAERSWAWHPQVTSPIFGIGGQVDKSVSAWDRRFGPAGQLALSYGRTRPDFASSSSWERASLGPKALVMVRSWAGGLGSGVSWGMLMSAEAWWTVPSKLGRWTAWVELDMAHGRFGDAERHPVYVGGIRLGRGYGPGAMAGGSLLHGSVEFRKMLLAGVEGLLFVDWDLVAGLDYAGWTSNRGLWSAGGRLDLPGLGDFASFLQLGFGQDSFVVFGGLGRRL